MESKQKVKIFNDLGNNGIRTKRKKTTNEHMKIRSDVLLIWSREDNIVHFLPYAINMNTSEVMLTLVL